MIDQEVGRTLFDRCCQNSLPLFAKSDDVSRNVGKHFNTSRHPLLSFLLESPYSFSVRMLNSMDHDTAIDLGVEGCCSVEVFIAAVKGRLD
jgi:hypothetical protein